MDRSNHYCMIRITICFTSLTILVGKYSVGPCALPIHLTTNWWRMRGYKSFIAFDHRPSPLVLERIVKSLTIPPSQCVSNNSNLSSGSNTTCQTVCLSDPSNNQLVKDERTQIFYHIRSQTKPIGIGANCEIPHNVNYIAYIFMHLNLKNIKRFNFNLLCFYVIL